MSVSFLDNLPGKFKRNTLDLCGDLGKQWLRNLPQIIEEIEKKWLIKAESPFQNLSYNYVAPCICANGDEAVLKIALPLNNPEIYNEAKYLQIAKGNGAVKLLNIYKDRRAILLEKLTPGETLKKVCHRDETRAIEIAIQTMHKLLKEPPPNCNFRTLGEWFNSFFEKVAGTKFPIEAQKKARRYYEQLSSSSKSKFLIHGDLHHENILSNGQESFLAIDPKGIVGEIGYEIAVFLNNHLWWLASEKQWREKLNIAVRGFSEVFEIEPANLRKWAYTQMVLSAWWTFDENGENWETDLALAERWLQLEPIIAHK